MATSSSGGRLHSPWAGHAVLACVAILLAGAGRVAAQPAAPPDVDATATAAGDAPFEGRVAAYLLSPDAGVAGLIFDDGRQVSVPPHLGAALAALIQPGQQARIGARRDDLRGPGGLRTITSTANGRTLAADAPGERSVGPRADSVGLRPLHAAGTIRLRLHGPRGEINGLLLDTGTQIFFPPHVAREAGDWLRPGTAIDIDGYGQRSAFGTALQATRLAGPGGRSVTVYRSLDAATRKDAGSNPPGRTPQGHGP